MGRLEKMLRSRSAVIVLGALWLFWLAVQFVTGVTESRHEALEHGQQFAWSEFLPDFLNKVSENNASEMFQVIVAAWVFKHFLYTGSPESRDTDDGGAAR